MSDARRTLPAVSRVLDLAADDPACQQWPRADLVEAARYVLEVVRDGGPRPPDDDWAGAVRSWLEARDRRSIRPTINATGVPLHTNLGRAPFAAAAQEAVTRALGYSTLEFDREAGGRGSRQSHVAPLIADVTGAEAAIVVNNAASALILVLSALAERGETIVSRGELVEIGGSFRIPDILRKSGSVLVEVGTTNRTRLADYVAALSPRTRLILKVHRSNFQQRGFVSDADVAELAAFGQAHRIPVVHDVGSGLLVNLEPYGLTGEPTVQATVRTGAVAVFSGDKLLGGPQAGIIAGPAETIAVIARDPLARALRPDKVTFAALEATLRLYRDPAVALRTIPVLRMLTATPDELATRAATLAEGLPGARTIPGTSTVGGGAFPDCTLPTTLVAVDVPSVDAALAALRAHDPPIVARASDGAVVFDVRTLTDGDMPLVRGAMERLTPGV